MSLSPVDRHPALTAVIPALDEEGSIGRVVVGLRAAGVGRVLVGDNGSTDATAARAVAAGAEVVRVARRGYGSACLGALGRLDPECRAVVFCDADGADDLAVLPDLVEPVLAGRVDLHVASRRRGRSEPGALTVPQRFGNALAAACIRAFYRLPVSDLGPFRCVSRAALDRLAMRDPDFGWTVEMQVKAARLRLRYRELPVRALRRRHGRSKISGTVAGTLRAGTVILRSIALYGLLPIPGRKAVAC